MSIIPPRWIAVALPRLVPKAEDLPIENKKKGLNTAAESASIQKEVENHAFALFQCPNVVHKLAPKDAKPVDAKGALLKTLLVEVKILSINLRLERLIDLTNMNKDLIQKMGVAENVWKLFQRQGNLVFVRSQSKFEKQSFHQKGAKSVAVLVATLEITHNPAQIDHLVLLIEGLSRVGVNKWIQKSIISTTLTILFWVRWSWLSIISAPAC